MSGGGWMACVRFFAVGLIVAVATPAVLFGGGASSGTKEVVRPAAAEYAAHVAPIFRKYCLGCHNGQEAQGGLVLETYAQAMRGGEHGKAIVIGNAETSRLIRVLEKRDEPVMPPEGNQGPSRAEIAILKAWIQSGAKGPTANADSMAVLITPKIAPTGKPRNPITAIAYSPDGHWIAAARYGTVEVLSAADRKLIKTLTGHAGSVNDVGFSSDGSLLFAAAGEAGLYGELTVWKTGDWTRAIKLRGHRDGLLAAEISPDQRTVATASYDQTILLWDLVTGKRLRSLAGHNGPVFDVAFDPTGRLLASASGDRTVKLWDVATGERLDTFSQPTKDQYAVAFTADGRTVIAGGVDNRIRAWRLSSTAKEGTNEVVRSLFAHHGPIIRLAVSRDGHWLASSSEDRTIKIWDADRFVQVKELADQSDWTTALAISPDAKTLVAGRIDGSLSVQPLGDMLASIAAPPAPLDYAMIPVNAASVASATADALTETEPNDVPAQATDISAPVTIKGLLSLDSKRRPDVDLFRFSSQAGRTWIVETSAARMKSPADTRIDILDAEGAPVVRCLLRGVRDAAITFRPIDSRQGDVRLENWQEMDLDQFLYLSGEVCRLFAAPRGPDSGFRFYPGAGGRRCYFDTSAVSHALNEPVYIVEPYTSGTKLADNGLPVFPLYYSNDDDGSRKLGSDSRLTFTAPKDGKYLVRVADVRGYGGPDFKYTLTVREPRPDFKVARNPMNLTVPAGSGQRFVVNLDRIDDFEGAVRIDVTGVPTGYHVTSPLVVQAGLTEAMGVMDADSKAKAATKEAWKSVRATATAEIQGRKVVKDLGAFGTVTLGAPPKIRVRLIPEGDEIGTAPSAREMSVEPGKSVTAMLEIQRSGYDGELRFEVENLPHGVIVDNIGLNGIMIRAGENRRQISMSAAKWVPPTQRTIYARADREGNQTSAAIKLRVVERTP